MSYENQSWIEVVNGSLKGCLVLPSGAVDIVGESSLEGARETFRLFEKDNALGKEIGACWTWAGDTRRSLLISTAEGKHYGRLEMVRRIEDGARFVLRFYDEAW